MHNIEILYEDNHIILAIKPVNILSQADNTGDTDMLTLLKDYLKEKYQKPGNVYLGLVHRLDRPVGGIMVFAKTSKAASRLSKMIAEGQLIKEYLAVVCGKVEPTTGELHDKIKRLENGDSIIATDGKEASLKYEVLAIIDDYSLLKITLQTGRHHQIRVQFANINYPLYGDQRYGKQDKKQLALYAYHLKFKQPVQDRIIDMVSYPPKNSIWCKFDICQSKVK